MPVTALLKLKPPAVVLLHTVALAGTITTGLGDILTVNKRTAPIQVAAIGVTVNTPVAVTVPVLVPVKAPTEAPEPDAPMPIVVLLLAHVYVVPVMVLLKFTADVAVALQTVCVTGKTLIVGEGDMVTVKDCAAPGQPAAVGVIDMTAVVVTVPVLIAVNGAMLPDPDAAKPIEVLELVHA